MINGCFLAIPLPPKQVKEFSKLQDSLKTLKPSVKFQKADAPHVTLMYFGNFRDEKLPKIWEKVKIFASTCAPFELTIGGIRYFGTERYPRVAWLDMASRPELEQLGIFVHDELRFYQEKAEHKPFTPHLTLARIGARKSFLAEKSEFDRIADNFKTVCRVDRLAIYAADAATGERQVKLQEVAFGEHL